jgi:serine/threonine-protein kinase
LAEYQKSVTIYPDYADAQRELAILLAKAGRLSDAAVHFEKAIQLDPHNSWAHYDLGLVFLKMGRVSDAVPSYLKAVEAEPQRASYKDDLNVLLFSGNTEAGVVSNFLATVRSDPAGFGSLFEAVQFDTNHVALVNNMAWVFATNPDPKLRNGKYAVRLATRACEMTGFQTNYCVETLAAAYAEDSRFDEAIASAQLACSLTSPAGEAELLKQYQALLELFRSHQRYPYK